MEKRVKSIVDELIKSDQIMALLTELYNRGIINKESLNQMLSMPLTEEKIEKMLALLVNRGFVGPGALRDFRIYREYWSVVEKLERKEKFRLCKGLIKDLAEKYFVSESTVQAVIYKLRKGKKAMYSLDLCSG